MKNIAISRIVSAVIVTGLGTAIPRSSMAHSLTFTHRELLADGELNHSLIAQLFYPPINERHALMIVGKGQATAPADTARVELKFSDEKPNSSPVPSESTPSYARRIARSLARENVKPIVDALIAIGVPSEAIEVKVGDRSSQSFPYSSEAPASIIIKIEKPTTTRVQKIVTTASEAASKSGKLFVEGVSVAYRVTDCQHLESIAYQAAMKDAQNRAKALATAMGAELGKVASVAEPFYSVFLPSCNAQSNFPSLPFGSTTPSYNPAAPAEVQVNKDIFVTYPVK